MAITNAIAQFGRGTGAGAVNAFRAGQQDKENRQYRNELLGMRQQEQQNRMSMMEAQQRQAADQAEREYFKGSTVALIKAPPEQRPQVWQGVLQGAQKQGFDVQGVPVQYDDQILAKLAGEFGVPLSQPGTEMPAGSREFEFMAQQAGLEPGTPEYERAARVGLGVAPRAASAAPKTIEIGGVPHTFDPITQSYQRAQVGGQQVTAETVGTDKATIEDRVVRAKESAKNAQGQVKEYFDQLTSIESNIANYNEAIEALEQGAGTGAVQGRLPSVRAASVKLDNVRGRLGLDIIGNTTFGALSESELQFALDTALPTKLEGPELREWLVNKRDAQQKVADYLDNAIQFLSIPGNSLADLKAQGDERQAPATPDVESLVNKYAD